MPRFVKDGPVNKKHYSNLCIKKVTGSSVLRSIIVLQVTYQLLMTNGS